MRPYIAALGLLLAALASTPLWISHSDDHIRLTLVRESVAGYLATGQICPCPYSVNAQGQHCVGQSEYLRPRGGTVLCYPEDVTASMLLSWRGRNR